MKRKHFYLAAGGPDIYLPAESEVKVVEAVRKAAGNGGRRYELSTDAVIAAIEDAYAESADAYLLRPIEEAELRRELKSSAGDDETELDEQLLGRVQAQLPRVVADKLREACRAQFVRETKLSAREWQAARGRLLVLHDRTPLTELAARKIRGLPHANAAYRTAAIRKRLKQSKPANLSPRAKFAELNQTLPSWERYTKLGEVSRPIPADIYCAPVERPTT